MEEKEMGILNNINIDSYERYIELMIGSGKSLSLLNPKKSCFLNDSNTDLINFYKNINDPELKIQLEKFSENWNLLEQFSVFSSAEILMAFEDFNEDIISSEDLNFMIRAIIMMNMDHENFNSLFEQCFIISIDMFSISLIKSIKNTLIRLKGCPAESTSNVAFLKNEITISFKSGFYDHFKNLINFQKTELIDCLKLNKHLAIWYFLKENTKEKQLQYDQNGNLKTQYYRRKNNGQSFSKNIQSVLSSKFIHFIKEASLYNSTPIDFIHAIKPTINDILILNLMEENLVLSSGKNTIRNQNHFDLIKQITNLNSSFIIITNDNDLIKRCQEIENKLQINEVNGSYLALRIN